MKKILFVLIYLCFVQLISCSKTDPSEPKTPKENSIKLDVTKMPGLTGQKIYIEIKSKGNYSVSDITPEIGTSKLNNEGTIIEIITLKDGFAHFEVKNLNNSDVGKFSILTYPFNGDDISSRNSQIVGGPSRGVIVEGGNDEVCKIINEDFINFYNNKGTAKYTFNSETGIFTREMLKTGEKHEGKYELSIDSLKFHYNGITEKYGFDAPTFFSYYLITDKTKEYQEKYPEAGITKVIYREVMNNHLYKSYLIFHK